MTAARRPGARPTPPAGAGSPAAKGRAESRDGARTVSGRESLGTRRQGAVRNTVIIISAAGRAALFHCRAPSLSPLERVALTTTPLPNLLRRRRQLQLQASFRHLSLAVRCRRLPRAPPCRSRAHASPAYTPSLVPQHPCSKHNPIFPAKQARPSSPTRRHSAQSTCDSHVADTL